MNIDVRVSDFVDFNKCRRKTLYRKVRGYEVASLGEKADMGTVIHAGLAAYYNTIRGRPEGFIEGAIDAAAHGMNLSTEQVQKCADVCHFYIANRNDAVEIAEVISVEEDHDYVIVLRSGDTVTVHSHFDVLFRDTENLRVVRDHKTKTTLPTSYGWFDLDTQIKLYNVIAWRAHGYPLAVEHNLIRREVPPGFGSRPLYNDGVDKNGKAYHRKSAASIDPGDYLKRVRFMKSEETLRVHEEEIKGWAEDMFSAIVGGERGRWTRLGTSDCDFCPYLTPCLREQDGETLNAGLMGQLYIINP